MAGGEAGVVCIRQGDGETYWKQEFARGRGSKLHGFQIASGRLYFFIGESRFGAWDIASGRCLWSSWAPGSRLGLDSPAGCFGAHALVTATSCVLNTGFAKPLIFDSRSGARLDQGLALEANAIPSISVADGRFGLLTRREAIQAVELANGRSVWQFRFEAPQALAGEMPQVLDRDDHLFVQIAYNYGYLLEHLDSKTGARQWPVPMFVGPHPLDLASGDIDDIALYCSSRSGVEARSLADGQFLWKRPADGSGCQRKLRHTGSLLLNQPATAEIQGWEFAWQGLAMRLPSIAAWARAVPYCSVEILDARSGRCLQALNVAKPTPAKAVFTMWFTSFSASSRLSVVGTAAPAVLATSERLFVVQGRATTAFDVTTVASTPSGSANAPH
jgi:hypothetical protein